MTVKIKTFGSMDDAIEWFKEGRPKRIAAVVVVQSADAELSRQEVATVEARAKKTRLCVTREQGWRNAVCDYAQCGMHGLSGDPVRTPPRETTTGIIDILAPVNKGIRSRVPSSMAGALARILVVHPHINNVNQFCFALRDISLAADRGIPDCVGDVYQVNAKALIDFSWSLYENASIRKHERRKVIYRATAAAFFNALQGARVIKFSTSVPTADCIVK